MNGWISLRNWDRFQHYKDRDPPWVKLYRDLLSGEAWVLGDDRSRLVQLASILIAARYSNKIPMKWGLILKVCSLDMNEQQLCQAVERLAAADFLEIHHNQEDTVSDSVKANGVAQDASSVLASCTSEAEQSRAEKRQIRSDQSTARRAAPSQPEWFIDFRSLYPPRAGDQAWHRALKASNARFAEGHTPAEMLAGARRYAAFIAATGKANTEFVQQAASFLGPNKGFLNPWTPPIDSDPMAEFRRGLGLSTEQSNAGQTFDAENPRAVEPSRSLIWPGQCKA